MCVPVSTMFGLPVYEKLLLITILYRENRQVWGLKRDKTRT